MKLQTLLPWFEHLGLGLARPLLQYLLFPEHLLLDVEAQAAMWKGCSVSWKVAEAATGGRPMAFWEIYFWASNYFHFRSLCPTCFPKKDLGGMANIYAADQGFPPSIHLCVVGSDSDT